MSNSSVLARGLIEGFYGVYYTFPERNDMIRFGARHGFTCYIYGPKNDRQHRARWWEPYPEEVMMQFAETIALANELGMSFIYSISPITASMGDIGQIMTKLEAFYALGVRNFGMLLDDLAGPANDADAATYAARLAEQHAELVNAVYGRLQTLDRSCTLVFCPVEYHGGPAFGPYLHVLGERLDLAIDMFYTGPAICSPTISAHDVAAFQHVARRAPVIWDNYPANDLDMRSELHVGPVLGRTPELPDITRGVVINMMNQSEASKIAIATYGAFLADPHSYEPWAAWERALSEVAGSASAEALRAVAETALYSCLSSVYAPKLAALTHEAVAALRSGQRPTRCEPLAKLEAEISLLDESCYMLKNRMPNLRLRDNMIPWIESLEDWVWMARRGILALYAADRGEAHQGQLTAMRDSLQVIARHHKRVCGDALVPLAEYVNECFEARQRQAAEPALHMSLVPALG